MISISLIDLLLIIACATLAGYGLGFLMGASTPSSPYDDLKEEDGWYTLKDDDTLRFDIGKGLKDAHDLRSVK